MLLDIKGHVKLADFGTCMKMDKVGWTMGECTVLVKLNIYLAGIFLVYLRLETGLKWEVKVAQVSLALILLYAALTLCW